MKISEYSSSFFDVFTDVMHRKTPPLSSSVTLNKKIKCYDDEFVYVFSCKSLIYSENRVQRSNVKINLKESRKKNEFQYLILQMQLPNFGQDLSKLPHK